MGISSRNNKVDIAIVIRGSAWKTKLPSCESLCRKAALLALEESGFTKKHISAELAILLTGDTEIQKLNKTYRHKNKPTNVLSFPVHELKPAAYKLQMPGEGPMLLGDVIISLHTVEKEAKAQKKALSHHVVHMVVHGTLHLVGFDHEVEKDAALMERLEVRILKQLNIANPYGYA